MSFDSQRVSRCNCLSGKNVCRTWFLLFAIDGFIYPRQGWRCCHFVCLSVGRI